MSHRREVTNILLSTRKIPLCFSWMLNFSQRNCKIQVFSRNLKSLNQIGKQNHRRCCPRRPSSNKDRQRSKTSKEARIPFSTLATQQIDEKLKPNKSESGYPASNLPTGCLPKRITKSQAIRNLRRPLEWPEWAELFDFIVNQIRLSDTEKTQYIKIRLTGQEKMQLLDWVSARHIINPGTFSAKSLTD